MPLTQGYLTILSVIFAFISGCIIFPIYIILLNIMHNKVYEHNNNKYEYFKIPLLIVQLGSIGLPIEVYSRIILDRNIYDHQIMVYLISLSIFIIVSIAILIKYGLITVFPKRGK
jgi:hypothetical protein